MDFDQYVAARYGRLIEHAVLLGCAEGQAGAYVDQVLLANKKAIRRADDPDPLVREALERAIEGRPDRRSRTGPVLAVGAVAVAVAVGAALTYHPPPEPLPSLFALQGTAAEQLLEGKGYDVVLRPARACEPQGLVLATEPKTGTLLQEGATVTVRTAVPSDVFCEAQYTARSDAWEFVGFALGGEPPLFADTVRVVTDSDEPVTLPRAEAADGAAWGATFDLIAEVAHRATRTSTGMPTLTVSNGEPPREWCGVIRPVAVSDRFALRVTIEPRTGEDTEHGCPLTIDLYRYDGAIDAVVVYTPKGDPIKPAGRLRNAEPPIEGGQPK